MPSYVQLGSEAVWGAQYTPPAMVNELLAPLRALYGLGPNAVGAAGDNNHLSGRHRSYAWDVGSRYCTDRGYGTTDVRDQAGDRNWYRAVDVGIVGQALFDASHRIDAAVRAGRLPGVAEWFGTFDGVRVVGWFQGNPSTSDSSHLSHLHIGFWNSTANNAALMRLVFAIIAGTAPTPSEDTDMPKLLRVTDGDRAGLTLLAQGTTWYHLGSPELVSAARVIWGLGEPSPLAGADLAACGVQVPWPSAGGGVVDAAAVAAALVKDPTFKALLVEAARLGANAAEDS